MEEIPRAENLDVIRSLHRIARIASARFPPNGEAGKKCVGRPAPVFDPHPTTSPDTSAPLLIMAVSNEGVVVCGGNAGNIPVAADGKLRPTYEEIHQLIGNAASAIKDDLGFPDILIMIAGGGLIPGRIMRSFLKTPVPGNPGKLRNIPTQAIGLSLYEEVAGATEGLLGREVVRTQWLNEKTVTGNRSGTNTPKLEEGKDAGGLVGKRILIVDEVDDSRTTLQYAYHELRKDVRAALDAMSPAERAALPPTQFALFVVHNKRNNKKGSLPIIEPGSKPESVDGLVEGVRYYAGAETDNVWIVYPWEQVDILEHNRLAALAKQEAGAKSS